MKKLLHTLLLFIALMPAMAFAQGSILTIFSEDGDRFYLYLNGQQQNNAPQTNLRLDGLSQPYYKARIVFEDNTKQVVDKNLPVADPSTHGPCDVVYKIKRTKDGEMKLRFFSQQPIQANVPPPPPPADVYVMHYGQPDQETTTTQVTTTTTTMGSPNGANMSINAGGMNVNMNIQDPNMGGGVTQTTTTRTTTTSSNYNNNNSYNNAPPPPPGAPAGCQYPMDMGSFSSAKGTVKNASFEDTKLSTAKSILSSNCMSADQVMQICQLFGYEQTKLDFAKYAYSKTTDPNNYFKVGNVFTYDASKTELNDFISSGR